MGNGPIPVKHMDFMADIYGSWAEIAGSRFLQEKYGLRPKIAGMAGRKAILQSWAKWGI
jgi:hypothetical protein